MRGRSVRGYLTVTVLVATTTTAWALSPHDKAVGVIHNQPSDRQSTSQNDQERSKADERGPPSLPLIIKAFPADKTEEEAANEARERKAKQFNDNATLVIATGTLLFLGLQTIVFGLQAHRLKQTIDTMKDLGKTQSFDMIKSLGHAENAAKAARDSVDISKQALITNNRAYVHYQGFAWTSHFSDNKKIWLWKIRPRWTNSGNTPTRHLIVFVKYELLDEKLAEDYVFTAERSLDTPYTIIYPGGVVESWARYITGIDLLAVKEGRKYLYAWGIATYRDVFADTPHRLTKFCVRADSVTGDPLTAWNADLPLEIAFGTYHRHNCADEECETRPSKRSDERTHPHGTNS